MLYRTVLHIQRCHVIMLSKLCHLLLHSWSNLTDVARRDFFLLPRRLISSDKNLLFIFLLVTKFSFSLIARSFLIVHLKTILFYSNLPFTSKILTKLYLNFDKYYNEKTYQQHKYDFNSFSVLRWIEFLYTLCEKYIRTIFISKKQAIRVVFQKTLLFHYIALFWWYFTEIKELHRVWSYHI